MSKRSGATKSGREGPCPDFAKDFKKDLARYRAHIHARYEIRSHENNAGIPDDEIDQVLQLPSGQPISFDDVINEYYAPALECDFGFLGQSLPDFCRSKGYKVFFRPGQLAIRSKQP